ncbi:wiskott-Aldrich syndrome protein homolog 1-like [Catharus ustulatus]|uniref:wiskott-Aldrich syndrome protein homolog 1-like n=1 Tax=Catharus ustulatus TaxID=91951 RepID=UPI00140AE0ED|nr:wiskott-Aldrich syndrome protein homolog 1-like [Catharus ustulatus]
MDASLILDSYWLWPRGRGSAGVYKEAGGLLCPSSGSGAAAAAAEGNPPPPAPPSAGGEGRPCVRSTLNPAPHNEGRGDPTRDSSAPWRPPPPTTRMTSELARPPHSRGATTKGAETPPVTPLHRHDLNSHQG